MSSTKTRLTYLIQLEMTPTTSVLPPLADLHEMYTGEARKSKAENWLKTMGVPLEYLELYAEPVNVTATIFAKKLIVRIGKINSLVIIDEVLKRIRTALSKEWELNLHDQVYRFTVSIDKFKRFVYDGTSRRYNAVETIEKQTYSYNNETEKKIYEPFGLFRLADNQILPIIFLTRMNFCERVHLERSEWIGLWQEIRLNLTGSVNERVLGDSEYNMYADDQGQATVDICVEDFQPSYYSYTANNAPTYCGYYQRFLCICIIYLIIL